MRASLYMLHLFWMAFVAKKGFAFFRMSFQAQIRSHFDSLARASWQTLWLKYVESKGFPAFPPFVPTPMALCFSEKETRVRVETDNFNKIPFGSKSTPLAPQPAFSPSESAPAHCFDRDSLLDSFWGALWPDFGPFWDGSWPIFCSKIVSEMKIFENVHFLPGIFATPVFFLPKCGLRGRPRGDELGLWLASASSRRAWSAASRSSSTRGT